MKIKLRRCPFCNGHNLVMEKTAVVSWVKCQECGATGPNADEEMNESPAKYWNHGVESWDSILGGKNTNRNDEKEVEL